MTTDMRRLAAILLALSLAVPAHAADQVRTLNISGAGRTETDIIYARCDADHVVIFNKGATVGTSAGTLITLANPPTVTTFSLPAPSNGYGNALAVGCNSTAIYVGGGQDVNTQNDWLYSSTIASPGSWTLQRDSVNATNERSSFFGRITAGPGARALTIGYYYQSSAPSDFTDAYNFDVSPLTFGSFASHNSGGSNHTNQCSGDAGSTSNHYGSACWGTSALYVAGFSGSAKVYSNSVGPISCGGLSGTPIARQSFGANGLTGNPVFHLAYNGTDSKVCGVSWNGTTAFRIADQVFTSLSMVGGAYFGSVARVWSSGGTAYTGGGAVVSYFADESGSTYDFACDSGVLTGVVQGVDVDRDGDSTDNLLGFCSSGNLVYFGEALPSTGSVPRPKGARPFDGFPFTMPGVR